MAQKFQRQCRKCEKLTMTDGLTDEQRWSSNGKAHLSLWLMWANKGIGHLFDIRREQNTSQKNVIILFMHCIIWKWTVIIIMAFFLISFFVSIYGWVYLPYNDKTYTWSWKHDKLLYQILYNSVLLLNNKHVVLCWQLL